MNNDLISREALKETIISFCGNCSNVIREYKEGVPDGNCAIQHIMNMIDNAPTIEIGKCTLESDKAFICGYEKGKSERPKAKDDLSCQYCKYDDKSSIDYPCNVCKNNHPNMFEWKEDKK